MKILGIETSCDETALAIVEASGDSTRPEFKILAEALNSQTKIHEKYGGVYPMMAKREHAKNLVPLLEKLLKDFPQKPIDKTIDKGKLTIILEREPDLLEQFLNIIPSLPCPDIDTIAVTSGPGLEPALWVGINFAKALGEVWNLPVIPVNHLEGHIMSVLLGKDKVQVDFPALALVISGGHTQLILIKSWREYEIIGQTRDDAVGEAFDKVARMMELPYPGGPQISKLAEEARQCENARDVFTLPRPMLKSNDYDFSFSGLKTAVLYLIRNLDKSTDNWKAPLAKEFEDAVTEVLISKVKRAIQEFGIKTLILGGGVIANIYIRKSFEEMIQEFSATNLLFPTQPLSTDNAIMIATAGYFDFLNVQSIEPKFQANGNLILASKS